MDIELGGVVGEVAASALVLFITIPVVVIFLVVLAYQAIFGNTIEDFVEAKQQNKSISCYGILHTYTFKSNEYKVQGEKVVIKKLLKDKIYDVNDCKIRD